MQLLKISPINILENPLKPHNPIDKNIQATPAAQFQKNKQPNQKWAKELNRLFSKEDIQMANKHMKRCLTSFIIRDIQIKITMRYHFMPVRMTAIQKSTSNK